VINKPIYPGQQTRKVASRWWLAVVYLALAALFGSINGDIIFKDGFENHAPEITSLPITAALINAPYTYDVIATDFDGDLLNYGLVIAPENMSIGEFSGEISWTPNQLGVFAVELLVSDGNGGTAQQQWEIEVQAVLDSDGDGLSDDEELAIGTDPDDPDSDDDGLNDGEEVNQYGTDPLNADTDDDGLSDGDEINVHFTQPDNPDTDNDTYTDSEEIDNETDPLDDTDFPVNVPPVDPADVAPEIDPTVATTVFDSTEFLYRGLNRIQTGVANGVMEPVRVAVLRGTVMSRDGAPLSGVQVTVHGHPEYGETISRADGMYDLAVNGGGRLTVDFTLNEFLPVQRQLEVPWQTYVSVPEVALIQLDPKGTEVDLDQTAEDFVVVQGSVSVDVRGSRQSTMLFPQGISAELVLPGGTIQPISQIEVRATEYSVGENGEEAMPGELPPGIGYTYAVELSVDEALLAGAEEVRFDPPVIKYLENFPGFATGGEVPAYTYDKTRAVWVPSPNGRVIEILSISNGMADLDTDGDGLVDDATTLAELGINDAERQRLASLYPVGASLWRVPLNHFSPIDLNYPPNYPSGHYPGQPLVNSDPNEDDPCLSAGSVIECQNQTLGHSARIVNSPFTLNYRSDRTPGRIAGNSVDIPLTGSSVPPELVGVELEIQVAGRRITHSFPPDPDQQFTFVWDGEDVYGRLLQGPQSISVRIGYKYTGQRCDGLGNCVFFPGFYDILWSDDWRGNIGISVDARGQGLGGWTLSEHHVYDLNSSTLQLGDGKKRGARSVGSVFSLVLDKESLRIPAFTDEYGYLYYDSDFRGIAVGNDGTLYIADSSNHHVFRLDPDGVLSNFAGSTVCPSIYPQRCPDGGYSGDGGLAVDAELWAPYSLAAGPDNSVYIVDIGNNRIRRVDKDGIITTVAGNGTSGRVGDGGLATDAPLSWPHDVDVGPDGSIYITERYSPGLVRKVGPDGIITTILQGPKYPSMGDDYMPIYSVSVGPDGSVYAGIPPHGAEYFEGNSSVMRVGLDGGVSIVAGNGTRGFSGDGGPATEAALDFPSDMQFGPDGSLYIADRNNLRIRKVTPEGIISTVAGGRPEGWCDKNDPGCYGGPPTNTWLHHPEYIAFGPDGSLYISGVYYGIEKVGPALPGVSITDIVLPSQDGQQLFYFDSNGKHQRTRNAFTGSLVYQFVYGDSGLLSQIRDGDGNVTSIERNSNGDPKTIVDPYGGRTILSVDDNAFLSSITDPSGSRYEFNYNSSGLLTSKTDPNGFLSSYIYDDKGRLIKSTDASGGFQTLEMTPISSGYVVTRSTALNRSTTYRVEQLPTGDKRWLNTAPSGLSVESLFKTDGSQTSTGPDGTVVTIVQGPDPRFGMQSPIVESMEVSTPGGLTQAITMSRTVTLSDPNDPLSLTSQTDTMVVNGKTLTSSELTGLAPVLYEYDPQGRLTGIASGTGDTARTWGLSYDTAGYVSTITDPILRTLGLEYDEAGRLERQVTPDGRDILFQYDNNGNLTAVAPPGRPAHAFGYTAVNLLAEHVPPDGDAGAGAGPWDSAYSFNLDRQRDQVVHPDGVTISFDYDTAGRLDQLATDRGVSTFEYDPTSGYVSSLSTPEGNTFSLSYDASLVTAYEWAGEVTGSINQEYDNHFRIISRIINGGDAIAFSYDDDGLLIQSGAISLTRDPASGFIMSSTLGNVSDSRSYNEFGETGTYSASYNAAPQYSEQHTRDKRGRIIERTETVDGVSHTYEYFYDLAGRLEEVKKDSVTVSAYSYDSNDNRLSHNGVAGSYDDQDRLLQYGSVEYTYTANGDLETRTDTALSQVTTYDYDAFGNLIEATLPDGTVVEYVTDGLNRRIGKKVDGTLVQTFLYKDTLNPVAELDGSGTAVSTFIYASKANIPAYMVRSGNTYRIVSDHLGSPRMVIDTATGVIAQQLEYDEFGHVVSDTNPGFQPFGFAGGLYDADTQLVRFGARDYDASIGRWTARDPVLFEGRQLNLYVYAANDPVNLIDPSGLGVTWGQFISETVSTAVNWWQKLSGYEEKAEQAAAAAIELHGEVTDPNQSLAEEGAGVFACAFRFGGKVVGDILPWMSQSAEQYGEIAAGTLEAAVNNAREYFKNKHPGESVDGDVTVPMRFSE